ncbi:MAG TPA: alkaline phosphatase [Moorella mulderi]|nr:alkaline phosphatase [Moorella mulderi]
MAKYIFLFVGDGLGAVQVKAGERACLLQRGTPLCFTSFPCQGLMTNYACDGSITDSAAAATAMASGRKTFNGLVNISPEGEDLWPLTHRAKDKGMRVGIISSVSLNHATPAAFYAQQPSRDNYYQIGLQLALSEFHFFGGGGLKAERGPWGDRVSLLEVARAHGFRIPRNMEELEDIPPGERVIAINPHLDGEQALPYAVEGQGGWSLAQFTRKAIECLDNSRGFFLMVEGGKIDWACHANDTFRALGEILAFNEAVSQALEFYRRRPEETLIVVTGDHETGGMMMEDRACSSWEELLSSIKWTTGGHTEDPIPVFALGRGAELFRGFYDNTEICWKLLQVLSSPQAFWRDAWSNEGLLPPAAAGK